jgi:putative oxidoreductase
MPYGLAALRIVSGLLFIEHGTQKLFGVPAPPAHGLSPLLSLTGIAACLEICGGFLLVLAIELSSLDRNIVATALLCAACVDAG